MAVILAHASRFFLLAADRARRFAVVAAIFCLIPSALAFRSPLSVQPLPTSPLETRAGVFDGDASGLFCSDRSDSYEITAGCEACAYETASGLRRWLNQYPLEEAFDLNLYRFNYNSPLNYVDPNGESPRGIAIGAGIGGIVGGAVGGAIGAVGGTLALPGGGTIAGAGGLGAAGAAAGAALGGAIGNFISEFPNLFNRPPSIPCPTRTTSKMTPDQQAIKDLVDDATQGGRKPLPADDAETILDWADEVGYPGVRAKPGDVANPSNWKGNPVPHIHVPGAGRGGHVPVRPGVQPR